MKSAFAKAILCFGALSLIMSSGLYAADYSKDTYEKKVKTNDFYVGVVAAVVNGLCPNLAKDASVCNTKDPVGTALAIQKAMLNGQEEIDDVEESHLEKVVVNIDAGMQFFDAVEQFKQFFGWKKQASDAAKAGNWQDATIGEEQAWQSIVKTASRAAFAAKMVGDMKTYKMMQDLAADY